MLHSSCLTCCWFCDLHGSVETSLPSGPCPLALPPFLPRFLPFVCRSFIGRVRPGYKVPKLFVSAKPPKCWQPGGEVMEARDTLGTLWVCFHLWHFGDVMGLFPPAILWERYGFVSTFLIFIQCWAFNSLFKANERVPSSFSVFFPCASQLASCCRGLE